MESTPKSMRLQLALVGRVNTGKSSLLNLISGQDVAITSPERGTTTDVVEKPMELRPLGPVLFLDTAGTDDDSALGARRMERTRRAIDRAEAVILLTTPGVWGEPEEELLKAAGARHVPVLAVVNKADTAPVTPEFLALLREKTGHDALTASSICDAVGREQFLNAFTSALLALLPDDLIAPPPLLNDLVSPGQLVLMMVPIDIQAPRGRLILPQMQAIHDALDGDCPAVVAKENAFPRIFSQLSEKPGLVVCDSQAVDLMVKTTPLEIPCTTFSILMARLKGDMEQLAAGTAALAHLRPGERILVAEACTHHASDDDIGRVKIPRWLSQKIGGEVTVDVCSGADFPADLARYKLVIHCGSCMLNRRETLNRLRRVAAAGVPVTNYGMCISYCKNVLERVLSPLPAALAAYRTALEKHD